MNPVVHFEIPAADVACARREGVNQAPVLVTDVPDIHAAAARLTAAGGRMLRDPFPVGDMGVAGDFLDPEGNVLGLRQTAAP